ncbi:MAG: ABC transporter permease [Armatimonadota bacterium]|nr:ABC transporter permease [Armatimonadota bacterium]MDR7484750.1 ABC transporter permease [Armatimonadota bacterium]MDR7531865.1 ABC transporter permease [Armatimonadota bacterium]MDR7534790.1 ABC transporter permease [Armatimonadota bacterium]
MADALRGAWAYALAHPDRFWQSVITHAQLSGAALGVATALAVTAGVLVSRYRRAAPPVLALASLGRAVPHLAILAALLPLVGIGTRPALIALVLIAMPPILVNTYTGITQVDPGAVEAARGMGMSTWTLLWRVELPLVVPVIFAGLRTAAVNVVASATLATFIGGGGLGDFIQAGLALNDVAQILVGAVPVAGGAVLVDACFGGLERWLTPLRGTQGP